MISLRRSLLTLTAAAGLAVSAALTSPAAAAPAAQAAPTTAGTDASILAYADCPVGWFCVWEHAGGQGRMARFQTGTPNLGDFNLNDQVSSAWNRTGRTWCTYTDINYEGATWRVGNWQGNTSQYSRNDNISSLRAC
ncbi:peptidase inhibitor family I36 protein [Streptomyces sp. NPDC006270]|uniref:peptidase inhibitor family I36 protein n=1 Tax=Streptomyces sp. NPDC006270 TaxID=3364741 RepID=UPI00368B386D